MTSITKFETGHEDLVHGIEYDYYGKRLVTCSSDQRLKVWDFVETPDVAVWELNDAWKGHDASVIKALWAPPEFGQIIASCSFDRTVKIWEEQPVETKNSQRRWSERYRLVESKGAVLDIAFSPMQGALRLASCSADGIVRIYEALEPTNLSQWSQMEEFAINMGKDSTSSTLATPPLNTMIPTSSLLSQQQQLQQHQLQEQQQLQQLQQIQHGTLEPPAIPQHLHQEQFPQQQQQQQQLPPSSSSPSSQHDDPSYLHREDQQDTSRSQPPHLGNWASTLPLQQQQQQLHQQYHMPLRTPSSSSSGGSSTAENSQLPFGIHVPSTPGIPPPMTLPGVTPSLTMSSLDQHQQQQQQQQLQQQQTMERHHPTDKESGYCVHWCPNRTATAMMVVGTGKDYGAKIFKHDGHNRWYPGELLFGHTNLVNDVSWAPSMGRTYQLIATACKDHFVRIFKLTDTVKMTAGSRVNMLNKQPAKPSGAYHVEMVAEFGQHQSEVWRVEWNIMGTILSSSGSDGTIRLWRVGYDGEWREMAVINTSSRQK